MSSEADESTIDTAPTLIHTILRSNLPPEEKTFGRLSDELSTVLGAALETTAQTMRVALYFVYSNRSILNQLRAELATAAEDSSRSSEAMSLKTLEQLPYLTAVLTESLRLSPGAATRLARIAPDRPLVYDKWTIPAGTPIGMTTLLLHTDERVYPDAQGFHPERWLDAEQRKKVDGVFAPFSRGTRNCIGMQ
jgi:cytochrome P450